MDGDKIIVVPERVNRLAERLKAWVKLRKSEAQLRKVAILVSTQTDSRPYMIMFQRYEDDS